MRLTLAGIAKKKPRLRGAVGAFNIYFFYKAFFDFLYQRVEINFQFSNVF